MVNETPQALTVAGSDSDGSAGMQADLHTFFTRRVYGASVMTACVAGNSYGIHDSITLPDSFINREFQDLAEDYQIRATKTGMLADTRLIRTVVANLSKYDFGQLVVDPVITTKHGNMLLEEVAFQTLKRELLPLADVLTPNFYETQVLAGMTLETDADIVAAAQVLQDLGAKNIYIKGNHQQINQRAVHDYVLLADGTSFWLAGPYHDTDHVNGTGDSLSACIAAELAKGASAEEAMRVAKLYVNVAIGSSLSVGHKFGPINHWAASSVSQMALPVDEQL